MTSQYLTGTGLQTKRFETIVADLQVALNDKFGNTIDTSEESILGIINTIYASALTDQWELAQGVYDSFNIDTAVGKQLDDLVNLVGIQRREATATSGILSFRCNPSDTGVFSYIIQAGGKFSDSANTYTNVEDIIVTPQDTSRACFELQSVVEGDTYDININANNHSYLALAGDSVEDVIDALVASINSNFYNNTLIYGATKISGTKVEVTTVNLTGSMVANSSTLSMTYFYTGGYVEAEEIGAVVTVANTISNIDSVSVVDAQGSPYPLNTLVEVNNYKDFIVGGLVESDSDLRIRQARSVNIAGSGTLGAISATVENLQGVTDVYVIENDTGETDSGGRPAKSFEVVVFGGEVSDIVQAIWDTKPIGIESHGNRQGVAIDSQGSVRVIRYSVPVPIDIHVRVTYEKYLEEDFPIGGEEAMSDIIIEVGSTATLNQDIIARRFIGSLYSGVAGIGDMKVEISLDGSTWTTETIEILDTQIAEFSSDNIDIVEGTV